MITNQDNNYGTVFFAATLQNGPDGFALVDDTGGVLQFISYEGSFAATDGAAAGMTSVDIGLFEPTNTKPDTSLQLAGKGVDQFAWIVDTASRGDINLQQSFGTPVPVPATFPLFAAALAMLRLLRKPLNSSHFPATSAGT